MAPQNGTPKQPPDTTIPRFTIDLSLAPEHRYVALARLYKPKIQQLTSLFDDLLSDLGVPKGFHKTINQIARLMLSKLHSPIESAELRGISRTAEIPMYLLVSLNVVLDLLMGCTSGAVKSREVGQYTAEARMLHFRTLDWGMDPLRSVIVQLDYIQSKSKTGEQILGSSISYVGFVGVLTGVREGLSLSLNFRAVHDASTKAQQFRFYFHHLLVLLGWRQSISSLMRANLFGHKRRWSDSPTSLESITTTIPRKHTTSAYLIFCDGTKSVSMEKDFATAVARKSESFIVTTNHDLEEHSCASGKPSTKTHAVAMRELLDESEDRRDSVVRKWKVKIRREQRKREAVINAGRRRPAAGMQLRWTRSNKRSFESLDDRVESAIALTTTEDMLADIERDMALTKEEIVRWTTSFPTTNESTHFAAILDPTAGQVLWSERYVQPLEVPESEAPRVELDHILDLG